MANKMNPSGSEYYMPPFSDHPFWGDEGGGTGTVPDIAATASVDSTTGTPNVTVTQTGAHGENIDFAFSGLKGEKGEKGDVGPQGPQGPKGDPGTTGDVVSNVTMGQAIDGTRGTTDFTFKKVINGAESVIGTLHLATEQLVLDSMQVSENGGTSIGEIVFYTIDQSGTPGAQGLGIAAVKQTDGSTKLCPALDKAGTWEVGSAFATIPATVDVSDFVKNADLLPYVQNFTITTRRNEPVADVTSEDLGWKDNGLTKNARIVSPDYEKTVKNITITPTTGTDKTTYEFKQEKFGAEPVSIGTIEVPKAGGGGGGTGTVPDIAATASVDNTTGTPNVTVTQTGEHRENINFAFSGLKGEKGEKGDVGPQGPQGPKGDPGSGGGGSIDETFTYNFSSYVRIPGMCHTGSFNKRIIVDILTGKDMTVYNKAVSFGYIDVYKMDGTKLTDESSFINNTVTQFNGGFSLSYNISSSSQLDIKDYEAVMCCLYNFSIVFTKGEQTNADKKLAEYKTQNDAAVKKKKEV